MTTNDKVVFDTGVFSLFFAGDERVKDILNQCSPKNRLV